MKGEKPQGTKVAVYARLSVNENGARDESLATQCQLLAGYVREQELGDAVFYIDNDVTGTSFDRPGLARMVKDIDSGLISVLVVKDLSRLGRNNGETLIFLDYLRERNVRLVSLGDGYDSFRDEDDTIGIRTWVNEYYARDISKKVRANLKKKMQNGEYLGRAPFGYLKSTRRKNRLEVDERYREVIREIFTLYIQGWGYRALAEYMQQLGVPTPGQSKGYAGIPGAGRWEAQHIRRIITNRVYCGDTVQGVTRKVSFKSSKTRRAPGEQWIIVPDTHEPLVDRATFELAQRVRVRRQVRGAGRKPAGEKGVHMFTGFVFCAACGARHVYRKKGGRPGGYVCGRYNRYGRRGCSSHHVTEKRLLQLILRDVRGMGAGIPLLDRLAARYNHDWRNGDGAGRLARLEGEIRKRRRQMQAVYLDKVRGIIGEELYLATSATLQNDINQLAGQLNRCRKELPAWPQRDRALEIIKTMSVDILDEHDLDREFLELYIKKIIVLEAGDRLNPLISGIARPDEEPDDLAPSPGVVIIYNLQPGG